VDHEIHDEPSKRFIVNLVRYPCSMTSGGQDAGRQAMAQTDGLHPTKAQPRARKRPEN